MSLYVIKLKQTNIFSCQQVKKQDMLPITVDAEDMDALCLSSHA